jgi:hypothetical protein
MAKIIYYLLKYALKVKLTNVGTLVATGLMSLA